MVYLTFLKNSIYIFTFDFFILYYQAKNLKIHFCLFILLSKEVDKEQKIMKIF